MAFLIKSAGLNTVGTTGNDEFSIQNDALQASTIQGLEGLDSLTISAGAGTRLTIDMAGGADSITFLKDGTSSFELTAANVAAGAGGDILSIGSGAEILAKSSLKGGDGNDTLSVLSGGTFTTSEILLGGGVDSVSFADATGLSNFTQTKIALGSGADIAGFNTGTWTSATVFGGGGADSINIVSGHTDHTLINLDSTANGGGNDTLLLEIAGIDTTVKGKGGKDVITVSAIAGTSADILGNAGADTISITGNLSVADAFVGGGSGNDVLEAVALVTVASASLVGGGGADSISLAAGTGGIINGGAGADTIVLSNLFESGGTGQLAYDAFTDTTITSMDVQQGAASGVALSFSAVHKTFAAGQALSAAAGFDKTVTDGIAEEADFETAGLTARVTSIDAAMTKKGDVMAFVSGAKQYVFIQGGASGTADDFVTELAGTVSELGVGSDYIVSASMS